MPPIDRRRTLATLGLGAGALVSGASAQPPAPRRITILLISDVYQMNEVNGQGGLPRLATVVKAERVKQPNLLLIHAGDTLSPSLMSAFDQGEHMIALFNALSLDVFVPGNHEFDFGRDVYLQRVLAARCVRLACNMRDPDGAALPGHQDTLALERDGVRIGIVGAALENTPNVSSSGTVRFGSIVETVAHHADTLRMQGCDLVVAVVHTDRPTGRQLLGMPSVDLVLSGHNHDLHVEFDGRRSLTESEMDANVVVAIDIEVQLATNGLTRHATWRSDVRTLDTRSVAPDAEMRARVAVYEAQLSRELDVELATLGAPLDSTSARPRSQETAIGNFFADAIRVQTGAEVALLNGGSIRGNRVYAMGTRLTRRDILSELPFGNKTVNMEVTGAILRAALENGFSEPEIRGGRFPLVSGLRVVVDRALPPGTRIVSLEVAGEPLVETRVYHLATNDFMARGGNDYRALQGAGIGVDAGDRLIANDVMVYARKLGTIDAKIDGRILLR